MLDSANERIAELKSTAAAAQATAEEARLVAEEAEEELRAREGNESDKQHSLRWGWGWAGSEDGGHFSRCFGCRPGPVVMHGWYRVFLISDPTLSLALFFRSAHACRTTSPASHDTTTPLHLALLPSQGGD